MVEVMKIMATPFKRSQALSAPDPAASHCQPTPLPETPGHSWESLDQSLVGVTAPFSWVLVHTRFCLGPPSVCFPVLCKFWWLYGGVNGDLLQESLCHTQVCCTQSPCPCGRPLLTHTFTGDSQIHFSLCGVSGCWCTQGLFEPSEHLWWVRGLTLKVISCFKSVNFLISSMISGKFREVIGHV